MTNLIPIIGQIIGCWGIGFGFGYLLKMFRRFMESM